MQCCVEIMMLALVAVVFATLRKYERRMAADGGGGLGKAHGQGRGGGERETLNKQRWFYSWFCYSYMVEHRNRDKQIAVLRPLLLTWTGGKQHQNPSMNYGC